MAKYTPVVPLGKIIFRFKSNKGNICYKLVTKSYNNKTAEIIEGDSLISEEQALHFTKHLGIEIKELNNEQEAELTYEEYLKQEAELEAELKAKENQKEE